MIIVSEPRTFKEGDLVCVCLNGQTFKLILYNGEEVQFTSLNGTIQKLGPNFVELVLSDEIIRKDLLVRIYENQISLILGKSFNKS